MNAVDLAKNFDFHRDYGEYCAGQHPALRIPFNHLYDGLQAEVASKYVNCMKNDGLEIYKYSYSCMVEKHWNYFTLLSRGIILSPSEKRVVAPCLIKFFNYGEIQYPIDRELHYPVCATEKMDGSMGTIYYHNRWKVATAGSLSSDQSKWASEYLTRKVNLDTLSRGFTYVAEIIYPENRIVVPYEVEGLFLITVFTPDGYEVSYPEIRNFGASIGLPIVNQEVCEKVQDLVDRVKTLPYTSEGYVLRLANGVRIKLKSDAYCAIHRMISRITPIAVWESMVIGEDLDRFKQEIPEELQLDLKNIRELLQKQFDRAMDCLLQMKKDTDHMSDKDLGLFLMKPYNDPLWEKVKHFLFPLRKKKFLEDINRGGSKYRKAFFELFRPTRNELYGYVPSTAMNRFQMEE